MEETHPPAAILIVTRRRQPFTGALSTLAKFPGASVSAPRSRDEEAEAEALGSSDHGSADLVAIGPDVRQPLLVARQLWQANPYRQILFVRAKEELEPLARMLAVLPDLNGAWTIEAEAAPDAVEAILAEGIRTARARRQTASLSGKLNRALARASEPPESERRRRRLLLSQRIFEAVLSQAPDPIFATDLECNLLNWNDAAVPLFGGRPEQVLDAPHPIRLPDLWQNALSELLGAAAAGEEVREQDAQLPRADGELVPLSLSVAPVRDDSGNIVCLSFVARDVTERKEAEARQRLLIQELNHRVKNTLALVQAIARRTAQNAGSVHDFLGAFEGRLQAISAAHVLLSASWWQGASIVELIRSILEIHLRDRRVHLKLEDVHLPPELASALGLVLHELATNAAKYGALSTSEGAIHLRGTIARHSEDGQPQQLELEWREEGGPPVSAPARNGFGTRLITQLIAYQHGGDVALDWRAQGLTCRMTVPIRRKAASTS